MGLLLAKDPFIASRTPHNLGVLRAGEASATRPPPYSRVLTPPVRSRASPPEQRIVDLSPFLGEVGLPGNPHHRASSGRHYALRPPSGRIAARMSARTVSGNVGQASITR